MIDPINVRFRELRKALGLNTTQIGDAIGLSNSGISSIETGQRKVSDKHVRLLKVAFPLMSEHWLRTGEGEMFGGFEDDLSQTDLALVQKYRALPIHERQIVDEIVDAFALRRVSQDPEQEDEPSS